MNKKEKYIYNQFMNSIDVNPSFAKINKKINNETILFNKKVNKYNYFKMAIEFSFALVFACIITLSVNKKSNAMDSNLSMAETATNESNLTNDSALTNESMVASDSIYIIIFNNEKYQLSITNEKFDVDESFTGEAFTYNNQEYYVLKKDDKTLILYKKSDNTFYLATKIN